MREKLFVENLWQMCGLKKEWNNLHLLQQIFEYHLKKRTKSDVNWMGSILNFGQDHCDQTGILWNCICESLNANKRGQDGKRHILSIVADQFSRCEIKKNLNKDYINKLEHLR
ncbi:hypothetical protein GLOIN_2v1886254 [Rhizophagus irregularis DAOM 181602=DAOM 197198]|nr:hypothetical protein GLOIN_2v1886254 [Rhizophagus irregularis DAOM 181602=DAOM 197198]